MKKLLAIVAAFLLLTSAMPEKTTTIFVIGDSTAANKDTTGGKQERGWAMVLQEYFDEHMITVDNHAVNGRSSKSFIDEGRWDKVLAKIKPGDYVIIQFGHNDEKPSVDRHTEAHSTFQWMLERYVRETREKGGIPILMNCVVRRNYTLKVDGKAEDEALRNTTFKDAPKTIEGDTLVDTHGFYRIAPRLVAERLHVHYVDANKITYDLETSLGKEGSKKLHMWYKPGEHPALPKGRQDNTHYNDWGAHQVAQRLADALCQEIPVLRKYRTNPKALSVKK